MDEGFCTGLKEVVSKPISLPWSRFAVALRHYWSHACKRAYLGHICLCLLSDLMAGKNHREHCYLNNSGINPLFERVMALGLVLEVLASDTKIACPERSMHLCRQNGILLCLQKLLFLTMIFPCASQTLFTAYLRRAL